MVKLKEIKTSAIDDGNRVRIPQEVIKSLPKGSRVSWNIDEETGYVVLLVIQDRVMRATSHYTKNIDEIKKNSISQ